MAVYPAGNPGEIPVDPTTPVGLFRTLYGDTDYTLYDPDEPGWANFEELSDAEIKGFLLQGGDSTSRGIGYLYLAMAGQAAKESRNVKDYDLQVDLTKRAADLRAIAEMWFGRADDDDAISAEEGFELVPTGTGYGEFIPELTIPIYGRKYTMARWR